MLGLLKSKRPWRWGACGKHPVAGDFFKVDFKLSLFSAFSDWIDKGYHMWRSSGKKENSTYSWRFWAKGAEEHDLACGVLKESCDSMGRPYPFLVMGLGHLNKWGDCWELVPMALSETWRHMEHLSIQRLMSFRELEEGVRILPPPPVDWSTLGDQNVGQVDSDLCECGTLTRDLGDTIKKGEYLKREAQFFVPLGNTSEDDPTALAGQWLCYLKSDILGVPNAVFMGGAPEETYLAVYKRPLVPADFVRLWSVSSKMV